MHRLKYILKRQQFNPGFLGIFVNPFYIVRRELWNNMANLAPRLSGKILDIGCGSKPYERLFIDKAEYVGMEIDSAHGRKNPKTDVFYDGKLFPFADNSFDSAVSTQTIEHIFNPDQFLSETHRVLKVGGKILITAPFIWDEHEQPYDYARYSSFGLTHLLENHGFKIIEHRKTVSDVRVIFQLINCYVHKNITFKSYKIKLVCYILLTSISTIIGIVCSRIFPSNNDLYMDNIILAEKI